MENVDIELELASIVMLRTFKSYLDKYVKAAKEQGHKPILMPVTRKGYWLFRILYDNKKDFDKYGTLSKFDIFSDRYAGKLPDGRSIFNGRQILLYDDILDTGDNMFIHFVMLKEWGALVTPIAYRYVEGYEDRIQNKWQTKWTDYQEVAAQLSLGTQGLKNRFDDDLREFLNCMNEHVEKHLISKSDRSIFNISILQIMENRLCPLIIDLPIFKDKKQGDSERYVEFSASEWIEITDESAPWKFVELISKETENYTVNASFFEAPQCVREIFPACLVQDCVVKVKFQSLSGGTKIKAVLTPFAILRSVGYRDLIQCFYTLFPVGDKYYEEIVSALGLKEVPEEKRVDALISCMSTNINLYRAVYRAVVLYFSNHIGMEFVRYLSEIFGRESDFMKYDWNFMEHHITEGLRDSIKYVYKAGIAYSEARIRAVCPWERERATEEDDWDADREFLSADEFCDFMRCMVAESKLKSSRRKAPIALEQIERSIALKTGLSDEERRVELAKIILLFLEGSICGNYVRNEVQSNTVVRGFVAGENSTILLGKTVKTMFPYLYAFYRNEGMDCGIEKYYAFIRLLRGYFERKRYFDYLCTRKGFDLFAAYFANEDGNLPRKIEDNFFLVRNYLEGRNTECRKAFELVDQWEVE